MSTITTANLNLNSQPRFRKNLQATLKRRERCRKKQLPSRSAIGKLFEALRFQGSQLTKRKARQAEEGFAATETSNDLAFCVVEWTTMAFLSGSNHPKMFASGLVCETRIISNESDQNIDR